MMNAFQLICSRANQARVVIIASTLAFAAVPVPAFPQSGPIIPLNMELHINAGGQIQTFSSLQGDGEQFLLPSRTLFLQGSRPYQAPFYDNTQVFESALAAASRPYGTLRVAAHAPVVFFDGSPLFGFADASASLDEVFNFSHSTTDYDAKLRVFVRGTVSTDAVGYGGVGGIFSEYFELLPDASDPSNIRVGSASISLHPHDLPTGSTSDPLAVFQPLSVGLGYIDLFIPITANRHTMYMRSSLVATAAGGTADLSHTASFSIEVPAGESWTSQSGQFLTAPVPEPSAYILFAIGLFVVALVVRRRNFGDQGFGVHSRRNNRGRNNRNNRRNNREQSGTDHGLGCPSPGTRVVGQ